MPVVDVHAHVTPERYKDAIRKEGTWHGLDATAGRLAIGFDKSPEDRLAEMDGTGVDMQLVTPTVGFYQYGNELKATKAIARDCNDEIATMVEQYPARFAGLATLPMQDVASAIAEMERVMIDLKFKGVIISDHVGDLTYDEPQFLPFFQAAEQLGAIVFFHQGADTLVIERTRRYKLGNAIGNMLERALVFATLVFGGVMDKCPDLKPLLAHGGGYTPYGIARMDKVAGRIDGGVTSKAEGDGLAPPFGAEGANRSSLTRAPSSYLSQFHYDACTYSGPVLRFLIDAVGIDRVMLGTDYPSPMFLNDPVNWLNGLEELTASEKKAILSTNAARFLGL